MHIYEFLLAVLDWMSKHAELCFLLGVLLIEFGAYVVVPIVLAIIHLLGK